MIGRDAENTETQDGSSDISFIEYNYEPLAAGLSGLCVGTWLYTAQMVPNHQPLIYLASKVLEYTSNIL